VGTSTLYHRILSLTGVADGVSAVSTRRDRRGANGVGAATGSEIAHVSVEDAVHFREHGGLEAVTRVEQTAWERTFYADGTSRLTGSSVHIQGPGGGIILRDAGQIVFNDYDGSVNYSHGPHPQRIDDVSFCPFLAP